jgi:hypothetical protein
MIVVLTDGSYSDYGIVAILDVTDTVDLEAASNRAAAKAKTLWARLNEARYEDWRHDHERIAAELGADSEWGFLKNDLVAQGAKVVEYKELNT